MSPNIPPVVSAFTTGAADLSQFTQRQPERRNPSSPESSDASSSYSSVVPIEVARQRTAEEMLQLFTEGDKAAITVTPYDGGRPQIISFSTAYFDKDSIYAIQQLSKSSDRPNGYSLEQIHFGLFYHLKKNHAQYGTQFLYSSESPQIITDMLNAFYDISKRFPAYSAANYRPLISNIQQNMELLCVHHVEIANKEIAFVLSEIICEGLNPSEMSLYDLVHRINRHYDMSREHLISSFMTETRCPYEIISKALPRIAPRITTDRMSYISRRVFQVARMKKHLQEVAHYHNIILETGSPLLGQGVYGTVFQAHRITDPSPLAVKVSTLGDEYLRSTRDEFKTLARLQQLKKRSKFWKDRDVSVLFPEALLDGKDLFTTTRPPAGIKLHSIAPMTIFPRGHKDLHILRTTMFPCIRLPLNLIRSYSPQLLTALHFLVDSGTVHADMKPENIMTFFNPTSAGITPSIVKIIDLGSSCLTRTKIMNHEYHVSAFYRPPELVMGFGKTLETPIDMWSLGCILVELYTGKPLFPKKSHEALFTLFVDMLGLPPEDLLKSSPLFQQDSMRAFMQNIEGIPRPTRLRHHIRNSRAIRDAERPRLEAFIDLVTRMLKYKPEERITPEDALQHPFFQDRSARKRRKPPTVLSSLHIVKRAR